jgi:oxygen-independent coproporphyrinogen-3 oxidase
VSQWRLHPDLPIFAVEDASRRAVYVPGHVMPASAELLDTLRRTWRGEPSGASLPPPTAAADLLSTAAAAQGAWRALHSPPFQPLCLNLEFPYRCNLGCAYCYARSASEPVPAAPGLHRPAVSAAARLVAGHCARARAPFQLVVQGQGEPTMFWEELQWSVAETQAAAVAAGVPWAGHLSTNGQVAVEQAQWLAGAFTHVTLSCDGPPNLQEAVRPRIDHGRSSDYVRTTAAAFASGPASLEARVTVTRANEGRLEEVVRYLVEDLGIRALRLEPVFAPTPLTAPSLVPEDLAQRCLDACDLGARLGAEVGFASPRLTELHGEYCETARQTLRLAPDGTAVNCLYGLAADRERAVALGHYDPAGDAFILDTPAAARSCSASATLPSACTDCLNLYHCVRSCPQTCPGPLTAESARCRFHRWLGEQWILRAATAPSHAHTTAVGGDTAGRLREEVARLPAEADRESLLFGARRAQRHYALEAHAMPAPSWQDPDRCQHGVPAVERLLTAARDRTGAISMYVHLPFCRSRCVFCDCHSVVAGRDRADRYAEYVSRLLQDLDVWCGRGGMASRPVTTVHFGGGTPDVIGQSLLSALTASLHERCALTPATEWAIETTSAGSSPERVERLLALGFTRLHVGVQTLHTGLRRRLGRATSPALVLERLRAAMDMGMVTSVDLLYGLPGQEAAGLLADLDRLVEIGIHGVSLYRLNLSRQNRSLLRVFPGYQQQPLRECVMLQAAEQQLLRAGYAKNHYAHYALPPDQDLYFRHSVRGEDLLALGASASGCLGSWEYLCDSYPGYLDPGGLALPLVALAATPVSGQGIGVGTCLMAGWVPAESGPPAVDARLWSKWLEAGLLAPESGGYRLTALGAWLLAAILCELREAQSAR